MSGAALVLADIPTFRELWRDTALFVSPDDSSAWSRAIAELAEDKTLRERLATEARARAGQFTLARQAEQLWGLYSGLASKAAAA
jgi:glycosyltransferase involved in cell wall biosynthesis